MNRRTQLYFVGAHVPLTMEGNIMVDGVLASCYAFTNHDLAHLGMSPMRIYPEIVEWIFGKDKESQGFMNIVDNMAGYVFPYELMSEMK